MVSYGRSAITPPFSLYESLSEAQFMPVRICNVEEALAPRRILRRIGLQASCDEYVIVCICVVDAKYDASPPAVLVRWGGCKIYEGVAGSKARKLNRSIPDERETEFLVEPDRAGHVVNRKCHSADVLDQHRVAFPA